MYKYITIYINAYQYKVEERCPYPHTSSIFLVYISDIRTHGEAICYSSKDCK